MQPAVTPTPPHPTPRPHHLTPPHPSSPPQVYHVDPVNYLRDIQIIPDGFYVPLSSVSAMDNAGKLRRLQYRGSPDDQWYTVSTVPWHGEVDADHPPQRLT